MENGQKNYAIVTGAAGTIGQALVVVFHQAGYAVIAIDRTAPPSELPCQHYIEADLDRFVSDEDYAESLLSSIRSLVGDGSLHVLVNNAATQVLGAVEELDRGDWSKSINTNTLAPFFWIQGLLEQLESANGSVINIGSIHARLTKPRFTAYATSKAALTGLTQSLAVELGDRVRINAISPAAIDTPMLRAGLEHDGKKLQELADFHPTRSIGQAAEVAEVALTMAQGSLRFLNGSTINVDGGIGVRLHDPA